MGILEMGFDIQYHDKPVEIYVHISYNLRPLQMFLL